MPPRRVFADDKLVACAESWRREGGGTGALKYRMASRKGVRVGQIDQIDHHLDNLDPNLRL